MKVGDIVQHAWAHERERLLGVVIAKTHDVLYTADNVYTVVWRDGNIVKHVWEYDLVLVSEGR